MVDSRVRPQAPVQNYQRVSCWTLRLSKIWLYLVCYACCIPLPLRNTHDAPWGHLVETWRHSQNRKYITYRNAARGGPMSQPQATCTEIGEVWPCDFRIIRADRQTGILATTREDKMRLIRPNLIELDYLPPPPPQPQLLLLHFRPIWNQPLCSYTVLWLLAPSGECTWSVKLADQHWAPLLLVLTLFEHQQTVNKLSCLYVQWCKAVTYRPSCVIATGLFIAAISIRRQKNRIGQSSADAQQRDSATHRKYTKNFQEVTWPQPLPIWGRLSSHDY